MRTNFLSHQGRERIEWSIFFFLIEKELISILFMLFLSLNNALVSVLSKHFSRFVQSKDYANFVACSFGELARRGVCTEYGPKVS